MFPFNRDFVGARCNAIDGIFSVILDLGSDKLVAEMKSDFCSGQRLAVECDCSGRLRVGVFCRRSVGKEQARKGNCYYGGEKDFHLLIPFLEYVLSGATLGNSVRPDSTPVAGCRESEFTDVGK